MNHLKKIEAQVAVVVFFTILFTWPLISLDIVTGFGPVYYYLFGGMLFLIVVLFLMSRSSISVKPKDKDAANAEHV